MTEVVPSPHCSSCATAVLAIMAAVGFWICISVRRTLPSLVIFRLPDPSTNILIVPRKGKRVSEESRVQRLKMRMYAGVKSGNALESGRLEEVEGQNLEDGRWDSLSSILPFASLSCLIDVKEISND